MKFPDSSYPQEECSKLDRNII